MRKLKLASLVLLASALFTGLGSIAYVRLAPSDWPHGRALNERFPVARKSHEGVRNLWSVGLASADLSGAKWRGSVIAGCDLQWSSLRQADLRDVVVSALMVARRDPSRSAWFETDLRGADLSGADLRGARFESCRRTQASKGNATPRRSLPDQDPHRPAG